MFGIQGKNIVDDEDGMNFTLERMSEVARNFMLLGKRRIGTQKLDILKKLQFFRFFFYSTIIACLLHYSATLQIKSTFLQLFSFNKSLQP